MVSGIFLASRWCVREKMFVEQRIRVCKVYLYGIIYTSDWNIEVYVVGDKEYCQMVSYFNSQFSCRQEVFDSKEITSRRMSRLAMNQL